MDFSLSPEDRLFRNEFVGFIHQNISSDLLCSHVELASDEERALELIG